MSPLGLPYAAAGVTEDGRHATATCPACGYVAVGDNAKRAARAYAKHYEKEHGTNV